MLISAGCSMTYGSELEGDWKMWHSNPKASFDKTFTSIIAKELEMDYRVIARPGGDNRVIARSVLPFLYDDSVTKIIMNWSWLDRTMFYRKDEHRLVCLSEWATDPVNVKNAGIPEYLVEAWQNHIRGLEQQLASLEAFFMINQVAKLQKKELININLGRFICELDPYDGDQIPDRLSDHGIKLVDHPYWKAVQDTPILFREQSLAIYLAHNYDNLIRSGNHWNERGHVIAADLILSKL